jgi:hypothetical protein
MGEAIKNTVGIGGGRNLQQANLPLAYRLGAIYSKVVNRI